MFFNPLKLNLSKLSEGIVDYHPSLLVLDDFSAHKCPEVKDHCLKYNITPYLILGGYTWCTQCLDVTLNRPFKVDLRDYYEEHQEVSERFSKNGNACKPTWQQTVEMVDTATKRINPSLIRSSFLHCGFQLTINSDGHSSEAFFDRYLNRMNSALKSILNWEVDSWEEADLLLAPLKASLKSYKHFESFTSQCQFIQPHSEQATETFPHHWVSHFRRFKINFGKNKSPS